MKVLHTEKNSQKLLQQTFVFFSLQPSIKHPQSFRFDCDPHFSHFLTQISRKSSIQSRSDDHICAVKL